MVTTFLRLITFN